MIKMYSKENSEIVYEIDRDNRRIKAIIPNCKKDFLRMIDKRVSGDHIIKMLLYSPNIMRLIYGVADILIDEYACGIAICSPEDQWNEQLGIDIARTRAAIKRSIQYNKCLNEIFDLFSTLSSSFSCYATPIIRNYDNLKAMCACGLTSEELHNIKKAQKTDFGYAHHCEICGKDEIVPKDDLYGEFDWSYVRNEGGMIYEVCANCQRDV